MISELPAVFWLNAKEGLVLETDEAFEQSHKIYSDWRGKSTPLDLICLLSIFNQPA